MHNFGGMTFLGKLFINNEIFLLELLDYHPRRDHLKLIIKMAELKGIVSSHSRSARSIFTASGFNRFVEYLVDLLETLKLGQKFLII